MKKKIQFIINPISGGKSKDFVPHAIQNGLDGSKFEYDLWIWEEVDALKPHLQTLKNSDYDGIVAVGGDGTLNQIAQELIGSKLFMGFVPMGSGNGLARQLGIPMNPEKAISHLNQCSIQTIDTGLMNDRSFINVCGVGFDAKVSQSFASSTKRGLLNYSRCVISEYRSAQNSKYKLIIDGEEREVEAFMLSVANGAQWGNDFFIAPHASLDDGLLDVVIMSKPPLMKIPKLMVDLNQQKVAKNPLVEIIKARQLSIKCSPEPGHVDGEPLESRTEFSIQVNPMSLKLLY